METGFAGLHKRYIVIYADNLSIGVTNRDNNSHQRKIIKKLSSLQLTEIVILLSMVLLLNVLAFILPMKFGLKKLSSLEI